MSVLTHILHPFQSAHFLEWRGIHNFVDDAYTLKLREAKDGVPCHARRFIPIGMISARTEYDNIPSLWLKSSKLKP